MFSPAYNQQNIQKKVDEIFSILEMAGFIGQEKNQEGEIIHYTLGLPEALPGFNWWSAPANWLNKQTTTFIRYPVALVPQGQDPRIAFQEYAKAQIRSEYIDNRLTLATSENEVKDLMRLSQFGTLKVLADSFAELFSQALNMEVILKPTWQHYILEGKNEPLSADQKLMIIHWCIENQPSWVVRWWRDQPFEANTIDMDSNGLLCIESCKLLGMVFALDPEIPELFTELGKRLSNKYQKEITVSIQNSIQGIDLYLSDHEGFLQKKEFLRQFREELLQSTDYDIRCIGSGSSGKSVPVKVSPYNPAQIMPAGESIIQQDSNNTIYQRFNRQFLCQSLYIESEGLFFTVNALRALLTMMKMEPPKYLPLNDSHVPEIKRTIATHPVLNITSWRTIGFFRNGSWVDEENWENVLKKALSPTSTLPRLTMS